MNDEIYKLYSFLKEQKIESNYGLKISFDDNEQSINYHDKNNLLFLTILKDDIENCYRLYSEDIYHVVNKNKIIDYLNKLFSLFWDEWL